MIIEDYIGWKNYIGNSEKQKKITQKFYRTASGINYSAFIHDNAYEHVLWKEDGLLMKFLLKILLDLVFLVMSFFRCLRNAQFIGCLLSIVLWIILLLHTPIYILKGNNYGKGDYNGRE